VGVHALYTAASGMDAQMKNLETTANNVANLSTHGFKRDRVNFADLFYRQHHMVGSSGPNGTIRPTGVHFGNGVEVVSTQKLFEAGGIVQTDNPFDIAIQGPENLFFRVRTPSGQEALTRAGNFTLDSEGRIVTPGGDVLLPEITLPQEYHSVEIARDGRVTVIEQLGDDESELGRITLSRFTNPGGLSPIGKNLFVATPAAGAEQQIEPGQPGDGELMQGAIEASNVNAISELIAMIQGQRAYEINSNVIETADEAMQIANNLRG
jgi:flagellar basal-body rod protein FlgG